MRKLIMMLLCLSLAVAAASGCRDDDRDRPRQAQEIRLTDSNYRQLSEGMYLADVQAILGPGERVTPVTRDSDDDDPDVFVTYRWTEGERQVVVQFENGKANKITRDGF